SAPPLYPPSFPTRRSSDLVPQSARRRSIVEHITKVRVAAPARHLTLDAEAAARRMRHDVFLRDRLPETRPAGTGVEFRRGAEERSEEHTSELQSLRHLVCR